MSLGLSAENRSLGILTQLRWFGNERISETPFPAPDFVDTSKQIGDQKLDHI